MVVVSIWQESYLVICGDIKFENTERLFEPYVIYNNIIEISEQ